MTDFSFCSDFLDKFGNHINPTPETFFRGNIAFGSVHSMGFISPSRRDDLISLTYVLIYLIQGSLGILENVSNLSKAQSFKNIYSAKLELTPERLCKSPRAHCFLDFVKEIHELKFEETPNYLNLIILLVQILNDHGI